MNRLLFWAATLGWFLNTFALAHPAARLAKVDSQGVLCWQDDGAEVALFVEPSNWFWWNETVRFGAPMCR